MTAIIPLIGKVVEGNALTQEEASRAFQIILSGGATPAQIAALLTALRMKGETVGEITGAVIAMRAKMLPFSAPANAIDVCGTGGDGLHTLNISTAVALVVAGCGVDVVKHGNRAVSSRSGSADVLAELGVNTMAEPERMATVLRQAHVAFLFAPNHHIALRHVQPVRAELKLRTIANLLGPLCNPGSVTRQLMGVYSPDLLEPMAETLQRLGSETAWVVHGADGMDEISLTGPTEICELRHTELRRFSITPQDAGLEPCEPGELAGGDAATNARELDRLLAGRDFTYRRIVLLNSAAALIIAGRVQTLTEGVELAATSIDSGAARHALTLLATLTAAEPDDE